MAVAVAVSRRSVGRGRRGGRGQPAPDRGGGKHLLVAVAMAAGSSSTYRETILITMKKDIPSAGRFTWPPLYDFLVLLFLLSAALVAFVPASHSVPPFSWQYALAQYIRLDSFMKEAVISGFAIHWIEMVMAYFLLLKPMEEAGVLDPMDTAKRMFLVLANGSVAYQRFAHLKRQLMPTRTESGSPDLQDKQDKKEKKGVGRARR